MDKSWIKKFRDAFAGITKGIRGQNSFYVHFPVSLLVISLALLLKLDSTRICVLLICIAIVISSELFNSSIERLAKSITVKHDQNIGDALDIASGAVLAAAIIAMIVGAVILLPPIMTVFF